MHSRPQKLRNWMVWSVAVGAVLGNLPANGQGPPPVLTPRKAMQLAIRELTTEARAAWTDQRLTRRSTTFADQFEARTGVDIPPNVVWATLRSRTSDDAFIDAYIRWQLIGFEPEIPELTDRSFEEFIAHLPPYQLNPRSNNIVVKKVNAAIAKEKLSEREVEAVAKLEADLKKQEKIATLFNRPVAQLRAWVEKESAGTSHRLHQLRLSRLAGLVGTGWNVERLKNEVRAGFNTTQDDRSFTVEQRKRVAQLATRLIGRRTSIVIRIRAVEGVLQAQFDEAAIYDFEVNEWVRIMTGRSTEPPAS